MTLAQVVVKSLERVAELKEKGKLSTANLVVTYAGKTSSEFLFEVTYDSIKDKFMFGWLCTENPQKLREIMNSDAFSLTTLTYPIKETK